MGKALNYKVGELIYVYFGDSMRKCLLKKVRKQGYYFVEFKVVDIDKPKTIVGIHIDKVCKETEPYGGYGIEIARDDVHLFTRDDFEDMRRASDGDLKSMCRACGFSYKEFKDAFEPFRTSEPRRATANA